jgi:hypothetical protein
MTRVRAALVADCAVAALLALVLYLIARILR